MFSGIVSEVGKILLVSRNSAKEDTVKLIVQTPYNDLIVGESVSINGVCVTVVEQETDDAAEKELSNVLFHLSPETLEKTNLGKLTPDSWVHLERAMTLGSRISGHLVQGHVDGVATVQKIALPPKPNSENACALVRCKVPENLSNYLVEKGSVGLDGVSLTINKVDGSEFEVMLIPVTLEHTRFKNLNVGDKLNIEIDMIAKYAEKLCQPYKTL